jgi:hypothetical protein
VNLRVFRQPHEVTSLDRLRVLLTERHRGRYGAFWLSATEHGCPALGLFVNGDQACLFFIPEEGDPGSHSVGPDPTNFADQVDFVIDNYQADVYPRAMVVPVTQGMAAAEEFFRTRTQPAAVRWLEA